MIGKSVGKDHNLSPYRLANVRAAIGHYLLGRGASAVLGFATIILLVRVMDVAAYAGYIALMGLAGIATMLSSLGLERAITRFVPEGRLYHSEDKLKAFVWKIVLARLVAAGIATLLLAAVWHWLVALFDFVSIARMPWALAIFLVANSLFGILSTALQALVRQKLLTQIMVLLWGGRLAAIVYLAHLQGGLGLEQVLWLMAVPEFVGATVLLFAVGSALRHGGVPSGTGEPLETSSWPQWQEARSLAGHAYAFNMLASVPQGYFMRTLVAATLPVDIVAAYGFFSSIVDKLRMYLPIQLMYNLAEPVLVARYLESRDVVALIRNAQLMYKANLIILMALFVFIATSGSEFILLITAGGYEEHIWLLWVIVIHLVLGSHSLMLQIILNTLKFVDLLSKATAVSLVITIAFLFYVFNYGNSTALVFAPLLFAITTNVVGVIMARRREVVYSPPIFDVLYSLFIFTIVSFVFLSALNFLNIQSVDVRVVLGGVAALFYIIMSFVLGSVKKTDMLWLSKIIRR